jgi:uracil-DNA glycosylase
MAGDHQSSKSRAGAAGGSCPAASVSGPATPVRLHPDWLALLADEFDQPYMQSLSAFLRARRASGHPIYPPGAQIFRALDVTPPDRVRVMILGQDPYHGAGQAEGLCFSVPDGVAVPPSLRNIFQELHRDLGGVPRSGGSLMPWAQQGVLLLNAVLTVEDGRAGSHQGRGWEQFTDAVVRLVSAHCEHVVFMLWGSQAQRKGQVIDAHRHCILRAPHPSPLSAYRGFFGCGHFSAANRYLLQHGRGSVDWLART